MAGMRAVMLTIPMLMRVGITGLPSAHILPPLVCLSSCSRVPALRAVAGAVNGARVPHFGMDLVLTAAFPQFSELPKVKPRRMSQNHKELLKLQGNICRCRLRYRLYCPDETARHVAGCLCPCRPGDGTGGHAQ